MPEVIKSVIALRTATVATKCMTVPMQKGEAKLIKFASENEYRLLSQLGIFAENHGAPPQVIVGGQSAPANTQPDQTKKTVEAPAPIVEKQVVVEQNVIDVAANKPRTCERCRTAMIITTDAGGQDIHYCPSCQNEQPIIAVPVSSAVQEESEHEKKQRSRCECGRVKAAVAVKCLKCEASLAQAEGDDADNPTPENSKVNDTQSENSEE